MRVLEQRTVRSALKGKLLQGVLKAWAKNPTTVWDLASLAKPWNLENLNWATLKKHGLAYFQNILKIGVCFQTILKKYPLLRARRRPEGAAEGGAGGIFSK